MVLMRWILYGLATWALLIGLWDHDWRLIVAGVTVWAIWPLIDGHVEAVAHDRVLDELWEEDDDLAESA